MIVDLHNHTKLCNHAQGENFEYVQKAIENGTKYFGFSDHAPMSFDKEYRMSFEQMSKYEDMVNKLKQEYKLEINILLGYEVDFLPGYIDERVLNAKVDYLIGSVHFIDKWGFDNPEFIGKYKNVDIDKIWQDYFDAIEQMAKSGKFDIVGHIDLIKVFNFLPKKDIKDIAKNAIKAIKKADMTIELNSAGYRKPCKEAYPSMDLMELIAQNNITITFGSDAHKPEQVSYKSKKLEELAKSYGYKKCAYFLNRERKLINF
jgi:histidinol-phosphatase (PHP family)